MKNEKIKKHLKDLATKMAKEDLTLESQGIGSQRILQGYTGKIKSLDFVQLDENAGVQKLTRPQRIGGMVVAEAGEFPIVFQFIMDDGRTLSVNTLKQSPKSFIGGQQATLMSSKDWFALVNKTITCSDTDDDAKTTIRRPGNDGKLEDRKARWFTFDVA